MFRVDQEWPSFETESSSLSSPSSHHKRFDDAFVNYGGKTWCGIHADPESVYESWRKYSNVWKKESTKE